jgi:HAE1 family hydrophobic/amphiphilic exporter-1
MADKVARPLLERSGGVGDVEIVGGLERAINVWVDAGRLAAYQLPITAIRDTLARQNADLPGGNVTSDTKNKPSAQWAGWWSQGL